MRNFVDPWGEIIMADGSPVYPKTYRYHWLAMLLNLLVAATFGLFAAAIWTGYLNDFIGKNAPLVWRGMSTALAVTFWATVIPGFYSYLRLEDDALVYQGWFRKLRIAKNDIIQTHNISESWKFWKIELDVRGMRWPVTVTNFGRDQDSFLAWFDDIPNRELEQGKQEEQDLLNNAAFGKDEDQRARNINHHRRFLFGLFLAGLGVCLWGVLFPEPYQVCMYTLLAIPAFTVLMVALSGGRWTLDLDGYDGKLSIGMSAFIPTSALAIRALHDFDLVILWPVLAWATGIGLIGLAIGLVVERKFRAVLAVVGALVYIEYGYGAAVEINYLLADDKAVVETFPVVAKRVSSSPSPDYYLELANWGPGKKHETVTVWRKLYERTKIGDKVCASFYSGALGIRWYEIDDCPTNKP